MAQVILPRGRILTGGVLHTIADNLDKCGNVNKTPDNGNVVYQIDNQEYFEDVLTHDNIMTIATEEGNIKDYIMYAKMPYAIAVNEVPTSIYDVEVPDGLQYRTIKVTTGDEIITAVKKLGQWADGKLTQTFSADFKFIYVLTNPLGDYLTAQELKLFVDGFQAVLLTRKQYALENVIS